MTDHQRFNSGRARPMALGAGGRVLQGEEFKEHCLKNGLCTNCGQNQVKERRSSLFGRSWVDIPVKVNERGDISVYKGYCISPNCYSLAQAKAELGEVDDTPKQKKKKRTSGRVPKELSRSDRTSEEQRAAAKILEPQPSNSADDALLYGETKPPAVISDESTQNSGGSSQENQASLSSGNEQSGGDGGGGGGFARMPDRPGALGTHHDAGTTSQRLPHRNSDPSGPTSQSDRHITSLGMGHKKPRKPLSASDPNPLRPFPGRRRSKQNVFRDDSVEAAIRAMEEEAERMDPYQFLVQVDCHRAKLEVVKRGMQLMRELVFQIHRAKPETRYCFPNDTWCKTIKSAMSEHDDEELQLEASMTVAFVCSISVKYKVDLITNNNAKEIARALKVHTAADESCCMALECLTRVDGTGVKWREEHAVDAFEGIKSVLSDREERDEDAVEGIESVLSGHSNPGTSSAILALHNLACQENFREAFVDDYMRVIFADRDAAKTLVSVMQFDSASQRVVEAAISILRRFWVRFLQDSVVASEVSESSSPDAVLSALIGVMYSYGSESIHEKICELLASVDIPTSTDIEWKQNLSEVVCSSLTSHTTVEAVQLAGLHALCNIFGDPSRRAEYVTEIDRIIEAIIFSMNNFHQHAGVQARGCLALACISSSGDWYKEEIVSKGGITAIVSAFRSHVVSIDTSTTASGRDDVTASACAALSSLALNPTAASELLSLGLLLDFQAVIERDGISPERVCVQTCVINLVSFSIFRTEEISSNSDESGYTSFAELVSPFLLRDLNEDDVKTVLSSLNTMCARSPNTIGSVLSLSEGAGTSRVKDMMEKYPENAAIQEAGCAILANIYFQVPFEGNLYQASDIAIGSNTVHVSTHSPEEVSVLSAALDNHKANACVVKTACDALCNFISGASVVAADPTDVHISGETALLFSRIPKEVDSAMAIHEDNPEAIKAVLRLLLVATRLLPDDELQRCSASIIGRSYETMKRFPHDQEIHHAACNILGLFVSLENESINASAANAEGLRALLVSMRIENETVVGSAAAIISSLLQMVFTISNDIIEIDEFFECLVDCMYRFPQSARVQSEACSILASLATLTDPYVKTIIANSGGLTLMLYAIRTHHTHESVVEQACLAIGSIAEGIPDSILQSNRDTICRELLDSLGIYGNAEGVICAILKALCEYCHRDGYFEDRLMDSKSALASIVEVMETHIQSEDVQDAGCHLFHLLAFENNENKGVLGALGAVRAVVSAMLAHIGSTSVQKQALTALKHLARVSSNKEALRCNEAEGAIRLTIYSHLEEPQVVASSLSALNDVAVDTESREVTSVANDTMNCVLQAMKINAADLEVQKIACWLLRSYTFDDQNLTLMRSLRKEIFELLLESSSRFPDECGERAQDILEKL